MEINYRFKLVKQLFSIRRKRMTRKKEFSRLASVFLLWALFLIPTPVAFGQNLDIRILRQINLHRNTSLDGTFKNLSNSVSPLVVGTPIVLFGVGLIKKDSLLKHQALYIGATVVASVVITNVFKYSINRTRPFNRYTDIQNVVDETSPSFPSGHTSNAFALATSLSLTYPKWYIIVPSYTWATTVAYSRLDMGVHYPSDVIGGAIIGAGSAYLCYILNKKIFSRK
jgi:membrane-associated phospholipid phosphatase